jgi:hypothetical protein
MGWINLVKHAAARQTRGGASNTRRRVKHAAASESLRGYSEGLALR